MENKNNNKQILFTFVIPSYNAEKHLNVSLPSILNHTLYEANVMDDYEVIIVNDGSVDNTSVVAKEYAKKWNDRTRKDFVTLIEKENGQYGSVINLALKSAKGIYFKVLDADDSFNTKTLIDVIYMIKGLKTHIDVLLVDYSMEKVSTNKKVFLTYRKYFIPYKILYIDKLKFPYNIITMHSIFYRVEFLKSLNYKQIEGIYYSDSQYSIVPFSRAKTLYYMKELLYRYYIGRLDQSVNLKNMVKNRMHQQQVIFKILEEINFEKIVSANLRKYVFNFIRQMILWQVMLIAFDKKLNNRREYMLEFLKKIKQKYPLNYRFFIKGFFLKIILLTKAYGIPFVIKVGVIIYSKFRINILAEWEE